MKKCPHCEQVDPAEIHTCSPQHTKKYAKKSTNYRDRKLLDLARDQECLLQLSRRCFGIEGSTTVACHDNSLKSGKGMGLKADDSRTVWGCYHCHAMLDQGSMIGPLKAQAFEDAYDRQVQEWLRIAQNPCLKPWRIHAARQVLTHIGVPYE